ncbi:MAG: hypothetical protein IPK32_16725 [Verrucomicrobiaceae bacterium]|nr:hypothetical protein [Verrucomicrobiaceae bacterium]
MSVPGQFHPGRHRHGLRRRNHRGWFTGSSSALRPRANILFLGVLPKHVIDIPDALPRERWPLALCTVFLIAGGIFPSKVLRWRESAAHEIEQGLGLNTKEHSGH